jgi:hypothetical protein
MPKEYPVKGEIIAYMTDAEMLGIVSKWYKPKCLAKYIGGYCIPSMKLIYIKDSRKGDVKLLNHERGHLRGFNHVLYPTLMNATWVFRWINSYYPYRRKE